MTHPIPRANPSLNPHPNKIFKVIQVNLHRAKAASAALVHKFILEKLDLAFIQEPWTVGNMVVGLGTAGKVFYLETKNRPRACILVKKNINILPIPGLCSDDRTTVYVDLPGEVGSRLIVCSAYLPGDMQDPAASLAPLIDYYQDQKAQIIIGCDSNSHHTTWGSTDTNRRGELLFDYLLTNKLLTLNNGAVPTFVTRTRQEVLDITISNEYTANRIREWHVDDDASMSDHRYIRFDITLSSNREVETFRNPRATDWAKYRNDLSDMVQGLNRNIRSLEQLESAAGALDYSLIASYNSNCPIKTTQSNRKIPWWNNKLDELRKTSRRLFNRAKSNNDWNSYRKALTDFNRELRKAKRKSWNKFCNEINSAAHTARIQKFLSKSPSSNLGLLKKPDGTYTKSAKETLELMAQTHFPGSTTLNMNAAGLESVDPNRPTPEDWRLAASIFRPRQVEWAIDSFKPFKSSGEDGIFPALLQRGKGIILPLMVKIYRASFAWGYIPNNWNKVKVIFIPKAGDRDKSQPKSYRPISLTSFLLKTMEKVIKIHIEERHLSVKPLHVKQHAYRKGKSTESALIDLSDRVDKALEDKEIALCAFLDIEGAFDNTSTDVIIHNMIKRGIDATTTRWMHAMLSNRKAKITLLDCEIKIIITKGCPQGGVLSPLLWSIVVDPLICELNKAHHETQGYADDLVIMAIGKCQSVISNHIQQALLLVEKWCILNRLTVNATKTIIVPFTRKKKLVELMPPTLFGQTINFSKEVKYLGIIFEQTLTWNQHIQYITQKAKVALGICCRLVGRRWGLKPKYALWLYTGVIRPIISYGCIVWARKTLQTTCVTKLNSIQRLACLVTTGAMSTTPTSAMEALLSLAPLSIFVQMSAEMSVLRAKDNGVISWKSSGFKKLQERLPEPALAMPRDNMIQKLCFTKLFDIITPDRTEWASGSFPGVRTGDICWYTDGSRKDGRAGAGIYGERPHSRKAVSLGSNTTIFQAEMFAIIECVQQNLSRSYMGKTIYICSDSQAAIKALDRVEINSKLTLECVTKLNSLGTKNAVRVVWVPAHSGIAGNEAADELARKGSDYLPIGPEPIFGVPPGPLKHDLKARATSHSIMAWREAPGMRQAKELIKGYSQKFTNALLKLSRRQVRLVIRALTGHCRLRRHLSNMKLSDTSICRFCQEGMETPRHILCDCPALIHRRSKVLGGHLLTPCDIKAQKPQAVAKFMVAVGLEDEM